MGIDIPLFQGLSLRFSDSPPGGKAYPTARLQKGFILLDQGEELADEAVGFGVPVLKQGLQTIFPGAVALDWQQKGSTWEITAQFKMDLVERISKNGDKNIENKLIYAAKNFFAAAIRRSTTARGLLTAASNRLRRLFHWETTYVDAGFSIVLKVIYLVEAETGKVTVRIGTLGLPSKITEVVVMNEQSASHFDLYKDTSGASLHGKRIGCWDEVNAEEAWFECSPHRVAFRLNQVSGARLFRGRELINSRLAWAGFGYSFPPSIKRMQYELRIERVS